MGAQSVWVGGLGRGCGRHSRDTQGEGASYHDLSLFPGKL